MGNLGPPEDQLLRSTNGVEAQSWNISLQDWQEYLKRLDGTDRPNRLEVNYPGNLVLSEPNTKTILWSLRQEVVLDQETQQPKTIIFIDSSGGRQAWHRLPTGMFAPEGSQSGLAQADFVHHAGTGLLRPVHFFGGSAKANVKTIMLEVFDRTGQPITKHAWHITAKASPQPTVEQGTTEKPDVQPSHGRVGSGIPQAKLEGNTVTFGTTSTPARDDRMPLDPPDHGSGSDREKQLLARLGQTQAQDTIPTGSVGRTYVEAQQHEFTAALQRIEAAAQKLPPDPVVPKLLASLRQESQTFVAITQPTNDTPTRESRVPQDSPDHGAGTDREKQLLARFGQAKTQEPIQTGPIARTYTEAQQNEFMVALQHVEVTARTLPHNPAMQTLLTNLRQETQILHYPVKEGRTGLVVSEVAATTDRERELLMHLGQTKQESTRNTPVAQRYTEVQQQEFMAALQHMETTTRTLPANPAVQTLLTNLKQEAQAIMVVTAEGKNRTPLREDRVSSEAPDVGTGTDREKQLSTRLGQTKTQEAIPAGSIAQTYTAAQQHEFTLALQRMETAAQRLPPNPAMQTLLTSLRQEARTFVGAIEPTSGTSPRDGRTLLDPSALNVSIDREKQLLTRLSQTKTQETTPNGSVVQTYAAAQQHEFTLALRRVELAAQLLPPNPTVQTLLANLRQETQMFAAVTELSAGTTAKSSSGALDPQVPRTGTDSEKRLLARLGQAKNQETMPAVPTAHLQESGRMKPENVGQQDGGSTDRGITVPREHVTFAEGKPSLELAARLKPVASSESLFYTSDPSALRPTALAFLRELPLIARLGDPSSRVKDESIPTYLRIRADGQSFDTRLDREHTNRQLRTTSESAVLGLDGGGIRITSKVEAGLSEIRTQKTPVFAESGAALSWKSENDAQLTIRRTLGISSSIIREENFILSGKQKDKDILLQTGDVVTSKSPDRITSDRLGSFIVGPRNRRPDDKDDDQALSDSSGQQAGLSSSGEASQQSGSDPQSISNVDPQPSSNVDPQNVCTEPANTSTDPQQSAQSEPDPAQSIGMVPQQDSIESANENLISPTPADDNEVALLQNENAKQSTSPVVENDADSTTVKDGITSQFNGDSDTKEQCSSDSFDTPQWRMDEIIKESTAECGTGRSEDSDKIATDIVGQESGIKEGSENSQLTSDEIENSEKLDVDDQEISNCILAAIDITRRNQKNNDARKRRALIELIKKSGQQKYSIKSGDTLESIAIALFKDSSLAALLYELNKDTLKSSINKKKAYVTLVPNTTIILPTQLEIQSFKARATRLHVQFVSVINNASTPQAVEENRIHYRCRFGDTLQSIAERHPALQDPSLWILLAEANNMSVKIGTNRKPATKLKRGSIIAFPTAEEIENFRNGQQNKKISDASSCTKTQSDPLNVAVAHMSHDQDTSCEISKKLGLQTNANASSIMQVTDDVRIITFGNWGNNKQNSGYRLELRHNDGWYVVLQYEIDPKSSWFSHYSRQGKVKKTRIDLPRRSVRELAENDLSLNAVKYCESYVAGRPLFG